MGWYIYKKHSRPVHSGEERGRRRFDGSCAGRRWQVMRRDQEGRRRRTRGASPNLDTSTRICTTNNRSHNNFTAVECAHVPNMATHHHHMLPSFARRTNFPAPRTPASPPGSPRLRPRCCRARPPPSGARARRPRSPSASIAGSLHRWAQRRPHTRVLSSRSLEIKPLCLRRPDPGGSSAAPPSAIRCSCSDQFPTSPRAKRSSRGPVRVVVIRCDREKWVIVPEKLMAK